MIVFITTNGTVQTVLPSPVYQGQGIAGSLYLVAPFPNSNGADIAFTLANGDATQAYALTPSSVALPDVFTQDGEQYSVWEWQTNNAFVTEYAGQVTVQMRVYAFDDKGNKNTVATAAVNFTVQKGVIPLDTKTPTANQWANLITLYSEIKTAEQANTEAIAKKVDKANKANVIYATDSDGQDTTIPYDSENATPATVPERDSNGEMATATATKETSAVPLKQLNEKLADKIDKSSTSATVYANDTNGEQKNIPYSKINTPNTIVYRGDNGTTEVGTATKENEAIPKHQLESALKTQYQEIIGDVGDLVKTAEETANKAITASENALQAADDATQAAKDVEDTKSKLDNIEAKLNENIIKDPSKTYLVWKGSTFAPYAFKAPANSTIDWGDGTVETFTTASTEVNTHTYTDNIEYHLIAISGLKEISDYSFAYNTGQLYAISLGNIITRIGESAFEDCFDFILPGECEIVIPKSVKYIGNFAFHHGYADFKMPRHLNSTLIPTLGGSFALGNTNRIVVPKIYINNYKSATYWSEYADKIVYEVDSSDIPTSSTPKSITDVATDVSYNNNTNKATITTTETWTDESGDTHTVNASRELPLMGNKVNGKNGISLYTVTYGSTKRLVISTSGNWVEANPSESATVELKKITVGTTTYSLPEGGSTTVVQETGTSTTSVMSQKAVTDALAAKSSFSVEVW